MSVQFFLDLIAKENEKTHSGDFNSERSHRATYQIRCSGCGKFAKVISFDPGGGYPTYPDPEWVVDCKRCGECSGYSGPF